MFSLLQNIDMLLVTVAAHTKIKNKRQFEKAKKKWKPYDRQINDVFVLKLQKVDKIFLFTAIL